MVAIWAQRSTINLVAEDSSVLMISAARPKREPEAAYCKNLNILPIGKTSNFI
uniref:Uncharacterized protein n=1 Tax=Physcomitrium patens TaxID=3218 RepID=A0A2K1IJM7_PHYPA|nr:hypothetical protein PHYPA_028174 [Physcomitrium patens]